MNYRNDPDPSPNNYEFNHMWYFDDLTFNHDSLPTASDATTKLQDTNSHELTIKYLVAIIADLVQRVTALENK